MLVIQIYILNNSDKKDDIIPIYIYESDDIDKVEKCIKYYGKKYQYRKYKVKKYLFSQQRSI